MNLVDANVLLYAVNEDDPKHEQARSWLDSCLSGRETVGFSWIVVLAFLRLTTKIGLFPRPLAIADALTLVRLWTEQHPSVIVQATPRHLDVLAGLLMGVGGAANLTSDAHLAALAIEHDATVVTFDSDFARFQGVRWAEPGES
jgi:uncharacterized protein